MSYLEKIKLLLKDFFNDEEKVELWLNTENFHLGGSKPNDLIKAGREKKVLVFIESAIDGY
jgi:hypothetical protein